LPGSLKAIDIHVHPWTREFMEKNECIRYAIDFFRIPHEMLPESIDDLISEMDRAGVQKSVILGQDLRSSKKPQFKNYTLPNDELEKLVDLHPDRFVGFGSVYPRNEDSLGQLRTMAVDCGFKGLKIHGDASEVYPNDPVLYPIYEKCVEHGLVVLHHTGTTGLGYCKIKYGRPLDLDDVAQDFPDLKIICAHFGWPWMEECFAVAVRNRNVYVDISGWMPRYYPPLLITYMNGLLTDKVVFGTDYPMIRQTAWMSDFEKHTRPQLKEGVPDKVLQENARRLLKI